MSKREILAGATDQTIDIFIQDSSSTVGAGLTGLAFNTSNLTCYYRKGATGTPTALTLATQTVGGAHSDGGFVAVDGTNCPGQYRLDLSDTIVATAGMVTIYLRGATNMVPCVAEIEVVSVNKFDSVRMGMTALPNAAAEASGGLYTRGTGAGQINQSANGQIDVNAERLNNVAQSLLDLKDFADDGYDPSTNKVQGVVTTDIATAVTTVNGLANNVITAASIADNAITAAKIATGAIDADAVASDAVAEIQSGLATAANLATVAGYLDTEIAAILADTNELQTDWADGGRLDSILDTASFAAQNAASYSVQIGTAGSGLGSIPWNAAWDAEVQSECADAIAAASLPTLAQIFAGGDVDGYTLEQCLKLMLSALAAKVSGAATTTNTFRAADDSKDRITATVDADGNRTAVVLDATG